MKKRMKIFLVFYLFVSLVNFVFPTLVYAQGYTPAGGGYQVGGSQPSAGPIPPIVPITPPANSPNQQMPSTLSLTPPDTDLSVGYLSNIFGTVDGVLQGTGSQLLGAMFSIFNGAILVLAGTVFGYTFFVSTINTAHEGEVLGKQWSSIWIPLRTVIGVALLVPKATGYSFIQIGMLWVVVMGIGAADSVWNAALDYFLRGGIIMQQNLNLTSSGINGATTITSSSADLLRSLTCVEMLHQELTNLRQSQLDAKSPNPNAAVPNFYQDIQSNITSNLSAQGSSTVNLPTSGYMGTDKVCGTLSWSMPAPPTVPSTNGQAPVDPYTAAGITPQARQQMQQSRGLAVQAMVTQLYGTAQKIVANALVSDPLSNQFELGHIVSSSPTIIWGGGTLAKPTNPLLPGNTLSNATATYFGIMSPTLNFNQNYANFSSLATNWINSAKSSGWIMAGSYYQQVIALNKSMTISETTPPTFDAGALTSLQSAIAGIFPSDSTAPADTFNLVNGTANYQVGTSSPFITDSKTYANSLTYGSIVAPPSLPSNASGNDSVGKMIGAVTGPIGPMFDEFSNLANAQTNNKNPVVMLASLGALLVNISCGIFIGMAILISVLTIAAGFAWGFTFSVAVIGTVMPILGLFTPVLLSLLVAGLMMALYIPIIPFIIFTFGAIGWVIAVIEAVIAAPLVALGIAHPEGQPILGKAEPAVGLLVNVFLRPTFMIFGFLIGMMLSYVGIWILNAGFWPAYQQVQATAMSNQGNSTNSGFIGMFAGLGAIVIYALLVQQVVQKSFTLIYIIPDEVLKWIGINIKGMGGEAEAEKAVAGGAHGAAETGGKAVSGGMEAAASSGKSFGKAYDKRPQKKEEPAGGYESDVSEGAEVNQDGGAGANTGPGPGGDGAKGGGSSDKAG